MDLFFEQIVTLKFGAKKIVSLIALWMATLIVCLALIFVWMKILPILGIIVLLMLFGILFGTYKLSLKLFTEYEYIVTNDEIDFDKIIARNSRKRLITVDIREIKEYGKYNENINKHTDKTYFCADKEGDLKYIYTHHKRQGDVLIVFAPNEKIEGAITKYLGAGVKR